MLLGDSGEGHWYVIDCTEMWENFCQERVCVYEWIEDVVTFITLA